MLKLELRLTKSISCEANLRSQVRVLQAALNTAQANFATSQSTVFVAASEPNKLRSENR